MSKKNKLTAAIFIFSIITAGCADVQTATPKQNAKVQNEQEQTRTEPTQTPNDVQKKVQTAFDLEGDVQKKAVIPDSVIAILKSDERVDVCFQQKGEAAQEAVWFAASEIDLNGDARQDLIVKADDACLYGANQAPFWIFYQLDGGYKKILTAYGLQLKVLPEKENSFNKIEVGKVVSMKPSSEIYRFKNGEYKLIGQEK